VKACACVRGCPACVRPKKKQTGEKGEAKAACKYFLEDVLGEWMKVPDITPGVKPPIREVLTAALHVDRTPPRLPNPHRHPSAQDAAVSPPAVGLTSPAQATAHAFFQEEEDLESLIASLPSQSPPTAVSPSAVGLNSPAQAIAHAFFQEEEDLESLIASLPSQSPPTAVSPSRATGSESRAAPSAVGLTSPVQAIAHAFFQEEEDLESLIASLPSQSPLTTTNPAGMTLRQRRASLLAASQSTQSSTQNSTQTLTQSSPSIGLRPAPIVYTGGGWPRT